MAVNSKETMTYVKDEYGVLFSEGGKELIKFPSDSPLTSYEIPNGVTKIRRGAFERCEELTMLTIPESVTEIEEDAFYSCGNLDKIVSLNLNPPAGGISSSMLQGRRYGDCCVLCVRGGSKRSYSITDRWRSFEEIEVIDENPSNVVSDEYGVQYSKDGHRLLKCCDKEVGKYTIRKGTEVICENAFEDCFGLMKVIIPKSVKKICDSAFKGCSALAKISGPDNVVEIGDYAFEGCYSLEHFTIPKSAKEIGKGAFSYCSCLKKISIPYGVKVIKENTFSNCFSLEDVVIGKGVSIGELAFCRCYPENMVLLNNDEPPVISFSGCKEDLFYKASIPNYNEWENGYIEETHEYCFPNVDYCFLHVPTEIKEVYTNPWYNPDFWNSFRGIKEVANSVEEISMINIDNINQIIKTPVGSYMDKKGDVIILSTKIEECDIEYAIRNSFDIVSSLVGHKKLSISDSVYNVLLSKNKDDVDMTDKIKKIQFSDKITTVLSSAKIDEIKKKLSNSGAVIDYLDFKFDGELCVIKRSGIGKCWIVNRNGDIIIDPCSKVIQLSEKTALCIYSKDGSVEKQIIVDFNGNELASVDWGDVNVVSRNSDLVLLEKNCEEATLFSVYSISKNEILFPFQPYVLKIDDEKIYIRKEYNGGKSEQWYLYSKDCCESRDEYDLLIDGRDKYVVASELNGKKVLLYNGDVAEHADYWFTNGPCFGHTLLDAITTHPKMVFDYIFSEFLQVSNEAVNELISGCGKSKNVDILIYHKDRRFDFEDIGSSKDIINAYIYYYGGDDGCRRELHPFYQGHSFQDVFCEDPQYIISYLRSHHWVMVSKDVLDDVPDSEYRQKLQKVLDECERSREEDEYEWEHRYDDYEDKHDYEEDTYYALGGEDYRQFKESGGDISDMMDMMGF